MPAISIWSIDRWRLARCVWLLALLPLAGAQADWSAQDKESPHQSLSIASLDGEKLNAYLWMPKPDARGRKYPAVVMAHGCGGAHYRDEPRFWNARYVAGKYKVWGKLLSERGFMVLLVDSFSTRDDDDVGKGVCDSKNPLGRPARIDPVSVRPRDIAAGIAYLKQRRDIDADRIAVLGFSNGATAALVLAAQPSLFERRAQLAASGQRWFDLAPDERFRPALVVALYPGCGLNGYTPATRGLFRKRFQSAPPSWIFMASDDHRLPPDTRRKCLKLQKLDQQKKTKSAPLQLVTVPHSDHQFDYYENDEAPVRAAMAQILALFAAM